MSGPCDKMKESKAELDAEARDRPVGHDFGWACEQLLAGRTVCQLAFSGTRWSLVSGQVIAEFTGIQMKLCKEYLAAKDWVIAED